MDERENGFAKLVQPVVVSDILGVWVVERV